MKGVSPTTDLEIDIESFKFDLDSPSSRPPPNPTKNNIPCRHLSKPVIWKSPLATISPRSPSSPAAGGSVSDFWSESHDVSLLDFIFSPIPIAPSPTLFETLVRDPGPSARAAILYYLPFLPVVQRDIPTLTPALLDDEEIMISLATNMAYNHAQECIPKWELEYLLMEISSCRNRQDVHRSGMEMKVVQFYHFAQWQIQRYRQSYVLRSKQNEYVRE
ncbi:hypothetical protein E8E11_004216 [Didymella keratinophila]|nr:hypothetical protein E8E11_004216 [Didymella keratinophila]